MTDQDGALVIDHRTDPVTVTHPVYGTIQLEPIDLIGAFQLLHERGPDDDDPDWHSALHRLAAEYGIMRRLVDWVLTDEGAAP